MRKGELSFSKAGLAAVTQRYDAPSASAGLCRHGASAPGNADGRLPCASRHAGRALRNPLAGLSGALDDPLTDRRGTPRGPLYRPLHGSTRRLRRQGQGRCGE